MKKLVLMLALGLIASYATLAQSDKNDFTLAPQIGYNNSTYAVNDNNFSFNSRSAFTAGLIAEYYFSDRWSIRSGLIYDPKGSEDIGKNVDKLNYITIPVNGNWHFGSTRKWYLNFGPTVSLLTNAESELSSGTTVDIKKVVNDLDIGLALGIGYKFTISESFQLYIDYQSVGGFTSVVDKNELNLPYTLRNSRSAFNIGGVFKL